MLLRRIRYTTVQRCVIKFLVGFSSQHTTPTDEPAFTSTMPDDLELYGASLACAALNVMVEQYVKLG